jgi:hypothetical protein
MRSDSDDLPSVTPADRLIRRTCSQALEIHLQRGSHGSEIRFRHAPDNARRDLPRSGRRPFDRQGQCLLNRSRKEGSVNGAPDFAPVTLVVTNIGKNRRSYPRQRESRKRARFADRSAGRRSRRHSDLESLDLAYILATLAGPRDRADHRL